MKDNYIGLEFQTKNADVKLFDELFSFFSVENYTWYVTCSSYNAYDDKNTDPSYGEYLSDGVYSGVEMRRLMQMESYHILLFCLYAVPNGLPFDAESMVKYEDFEKSNASLVLIDAETMFTFYIKDRELTEKFYRILDEKRDILLDSDECPLDFITPETDLRTRLMV